MRSPSLTPLLRQLRSSNALARSILLHNHSTVASSPASYPSLAFPSASSSPEPLRWPPASSSTPPPRTHARAFSSSSQQNSVYDDFRNIFEDAERPPIMVESITETTFKLTDGIILPSSCVFVNGVAFMWDVPPPSFEWRGWSKDMFTVFETVSPKPDVLLFGTGKSALPAPSWLRPYLNSLGIQLDIMDSRNACATFNLLAEEGRRVAAAVLTLTPLDSRTGMPL